MKNLICTFLLCVPFVIYSQDKPKKKERLESYTASNGITYQEGDTLVLNVGSGNNGSFVYITDRGRGNGRPISSRAAGYRLKVARMVKTNTYNYRGVDFILYNRMKIPFDIDIENAIKSCEITPCESGSVSVAPIDKYDQLAKLKKLYDEGVLTEKEYEAEKKKLLEQ